MNINDLIKGTMIDLKGAVSENEKNNVKFRLNTLKMIKTAFMEYVTNAENAKKFNPDDDVSVKVTKIDEATQQAILGELAKEHVKNIEAYSKAGKNEMAEDEKRELEIINEFLPKEATEEDVVNYLNSKYPDGIEKKQMGMVIGEVKKKFDRVDGKLVAQCVNRIIK